MPVQQMKWTDRTFQFNSPIGFFPAILERFRGTPARLEELVSGYPREVLVLQRNGGWSMQEHAGHLLDLEELGERRLSEFLVHQAVLSAADMGNRKTYEANHNARPIEEILRDFRIARATLAGELEGLNETQVGIASVHPRLKMQIRLIDWVFFMAEHDDHHLARIRGLGNDKARSG
jgi:hypothetical protein